MIINSLKHISMCLNVFPIFFQCALIGHIGGTLEKAAESPMCCNVQCVIMCSNAFQCVFQCVSPNVRQCAFNVFSMCFSHIENKWSRDSCCGEAVKLVVASRKFNRIYCFCLANWYAFLSVHIQFLCEQRCFVRISKRNAAQRDDRALLVKGMHWFLRRTLMWL